MKQTTVVPHYLDFLDTQRAALLQTLAGMDHGALWQRPAPDSWSSGEHIDHARVLLRSFRRLLQIIWPLQRPYARLRQGRPYPTDIDDVYERPHFPLSVGWLWPAQFNAQRTVPLATLAAKLAAEHQAIRAFYSGKDEPTLGNCYLYDPAIGWLNMLQMLRVGAYHDEHHFRQAKGIWQQPDGRST